ncbi:hypothetical protein BMETH_296_0 [methanotrophic bacterial endosymbiont of Bathymodiolus sp.]|nr:hypothetical protein BMETH_296_0 [methanotrophic bacterial endosymbiont of Bathymodiolus sp.]
MGVFPLLVYSCRALIVFPTPVGVFLEAATWSGYRWRLPHARGGVSY